LKRRELVTGLVLVLFALYLGWRLLLIVAMSSIAADDDEWILTQTGAEVLGVLGDRTVIAPLINELGRIRDVDSATVKALLRLHKRYPLNREPYLMMLVEGVFNTKNNDQGRIQLIRVLGTVTGNDFCYHKDECCIYKRELSAGVGKVRRWWKEQAGTSDIRSKKRK
jgi:hypothetical protein